MISLISSTCCAVQDADGHEASATGDAELCAATGRGLSVPQLRKALGETLGPDTALGLARVDTSGATPPLRLAR